MEYDEYPQYPLGDFKTAEDFHLYYVFNDEDFRLAVFEWEKWSDLAMLNSQGTHQNGLPRLDEGYWEPLALQARNIEDEYCIPYGSIDFFIQSIDSSGHIAPKTEENMGHVIFDVGDKSGLIKLELKPYITEVQFNKLWEQVKSAKQYLKAKPRRRTANDPELIYAIFKARAQGQKYREILDQLVHGKLPHYTKTHVQIDTTESMERYYRRYMPQKNSKADT